MRFTEIGQQLRAYRLESGLRAEEIAARLGVSRAALYRYEKGEVIKLDTVKRLAELLQISPLSLLGIGVEYYSSPIGFFERIRQIEETADQVLQIAGPLCHLITSDALDSVMAEIYAELATLAADSHPAARATAEQVLGILAARKRMYLVRRPNVIAMISIEQVQRLLSFGIGPASQLSDPLRRRCITVARDEVADMATKMEQEPMGLQFGLLQAEEPGGTFQILRSRDRATLAINPCRPDRSPVTQNGVSMITAAEEAIGAHQRVAEQIWRDALKGRPAAQALRDMLSRNAATTERPL